MALVHMQYPFLVVAHAAPTLLLTGRPLLELDGLLGLSPQSSQSSILFWEPFLELHAFNAKVACTHRANSATKWYNALHIEVAQEWSQKRA